MDPIPAYTRWDDPQYYIENNLATRLLVPLILVKLYKGRKQDVRVTAVQQQCQTHSRLSGPFTWRIAAAVKPSAPVPARTPLSLPGDASRSPVANVALPLARGSAFLAVDTKIRTVISRRRKGSKDHPSSSLRHRPCLWSLSTSPWLPDSSGVSIFAADPDLWPCLEKGKWKQNVSTSQASKHLWYKVPKHPSLV